ncbi:genetic competence negative regulator [Thermoflavimicrobium dichotomicum]|uniref:Adapter protein MecA 1/2 n=1 Tax=Thermoflavimicrobium dichotomicum TaxID=46223 RepID=A0A1I3SIP3_9BACL|nr:genetic competence negative regulator [Thermoflavimicrobium dichotomicum]SFJ57336.1 adapter protein MecA 1/2 [Thermoflavimicrobium dichotomicum]
MRVERLGGDKIRFFLTLDDLSDRGIEKEDMWRDIPKVQELFNEMMEHAYEELGFEIAGPVAVEVHDLPTQGMVVVVTSGRTFKTDEEDFESEDAYELEVFPMVDSECIVFRFLDLEHLIQAAIRMNSLVEQGGRVYKYNDLYYLVLDRNLKTDRFEAVMALLSEFGEISTVTDAVLQEYGKVIWAENAIREITRYFGSDK